METTQIADMLDRIMTGDPWHGPSVRSILEGISEVDAARRRGAAHSIWELVLHMTGWAREVTARIDGRPAQEPADGDWPSIGTPTPERWDAAKSNLFTAHDQLASAIRRMDPSKVDQPVVDFRDNALGTGLSHYLTLHGIIQHTIYHAGQIAVLKRIAG